jgi:hypothetical protein
MLNNILSLLSSFSLIIYLRLFYSSPFIQDQLDMLKTALILISVSINFQIRTFLDLNICFSEFSILNLLESNRQKIPPWTRQTRRRYFVRNIKAAKSLPFRTILLSYLFYELYAKLLTFSCMMSQVWVTPS